MIITISLLAITAVLSLLITSTGLKKTAIFFSILGAICTFFSVASITIKNMIWAIVSIFGANLLYHPMLITDPLSTAFAAIMIFFLICSLTTLYKSAEADKAVLMVIATTGGILMFSSNHFLLLFLGLEILSIPIYILTNNSPHPFSQEASLKYMVMGAISSAFLLFGIAWVFAGTGSMDLQGLNTATTLQSSDALSFFGGLFILISILFKLGVAPFHAWVASVYQTSHHSVTSFMASVVKIATMALLLRFVFQGISWYHQDWGIIFIILSILTIIIGHALALKEKNPKKILAYSSIAHVGYLLMPLSKLNTNSISVILIYISIYASASFITFLTVDAKNRIGKTLFIFGLLSLAGIPPFPGFFAKFLLFTVVLGYGQKSLVILAIIGSLIASVYYAKLAYQKFIQEQQEDHPYLISGILAFIALLFGFFPDLFLLLLM